MLTFITYLNSMHFQEIWILEHHILLSKFRTFHLLALWPLGKRYFTEETVNQHLYRVMLLSHFSHVRLCATPKMAAYQAPPSLGFSRQEHWSGSPFSSPMHESENESEVAQSYPTLCDPMDCSLRGSSVHGFSRQEYWV